MQHTLRPPTKPLTGKSIIAAVCNHFGYTEEELINGGRSRPLVFARHVCFSLLHRLGWKVTAIGERMNCEHSNVTRALAKVEVRFTTDKQSAAEMNELRKLIGL